MRRWNGHREAGRAREVRRSEQQRPSAAATTNWELQRSYPHGQGAEGAGKQIRLWVPHVSELRRGRERGEFIWKCIFLLVCWIVSKYKERIYLNNSLNNIKSKIQLGSWR
jgi:hypothetical protein